MIPQESRKLLKRKTMKLNGYYAHRRSTVRKGEEKPMEKVHNSSVVIVICNGGAPTTSYLKILNMTIETNTCVRIGADV